MSRLAPRFVVAVLDPIDENGEERYAVVECASGEVVAYASDRAARSLARLLDVLDPTDEQIGGLLDDPRLLRTIELRHRAFCLRCGRPLEAGAKARWNPVTRLVRHARRCPKPAAAAVRKRSKAA